MAREPVLHCITVLCVINQSLNMNLVTLKALVSGSSVNKIRNRTNQVVVDMKSCQESNGKTQADLFSWIKCVHGND